MSRIPRHLPAELDDDQRRLYEAITRGPRAKNPFGVADADGALTGPFNAMLLHPPLGDPLQRLGAAIRHAGALSDREREMAILLVAASLHSGFEQFAHEHVGRQLGVTEAEVSALRAQREPELTDAREFAVVRTTRRLLDHATLTDEEYAEAVGALGASLLFELSTLVGYYRLIALQLNVFGVDRPQ
ncbi:carboxymuconolactone decarboxylase family protein [Amycolatopsis sp. NPDC051903]|uniref:carboxymuconolactone decarboxylase family protein n=1 Tax=Amycolatopsis sp. NPDC051903 TaxID=3363936 RepID=UPI0037A8D86C